ncbi:MAG: NAD(P)H-dependent oxidoreductase [Deltaproteobacteria bacterium]|nr:NAD(P)H-dependent oxidoreductase [Deltaproteobacteria bacterium]
MKISVINGSPKGKHSITLQYIHYFTKKDPEHDLEIINIASRIKKIEKDEGLFREIIEKMVKADAVIWSFPVYYALIPSQMKRFIELIFERCPLDLFKGKYATSFTTSINFFDHTAHNYMQGICEELGFLYVKSYSANMDDFFQLDKREKTVTFYKWFIQMVEQKIPVARKYTISHVDAFAYEPGEIEQRSVTCEEKVLLLTDAEKGDTNLARMVDVFAKYSSMPVAIKNIHDIYIKNGCIGCCTCGYDNKCIQNDGYQKFYNDNLKKADIIIIAATIRDHYLSSTWKRFLDRSFFNGHAPVLMGKRLGFIISGPLSRIQNLRETLEALAEIWHMKTSGIVTDEFKTSADITRHIQAFVKELELASYQNLEFGSKFYQVAGKAIFRDFIYLTSAVFRADHIFYKRSGFYKNFPQRKIKKRLYNTIFSLFISIKPIRKIIHGKFIPGMVAPYIKILNKI